MTFGDKYFFVLGTVLGTTQCLAASMTLTHQMPGAVPSCDNQKCFQTLGISPRRDKILENPRSIGDALGHPTKSSIPELLEMESEYLGIRASNYHGHYEHAGGGH
jgi:hypothetical protein